MEKRNSTTDILGISFSLKRAARFTSIGNKVSRGEIDVPTTMQDLER